MIWSFLMMLWILRLTLWGVEPKSNYVRTASTLLRTAWLSKTAYIEIHSGEMANKCTLCDYAALKANHMRNHMWKHTKVLKPTNAIFWGIQTEEVNDDTQQRKALESTFNWKFHYRRKQKYLNIFCIFMGKWGKILCKLLGMKSQKSCGTTSVAKWIQWWRKFCCNILESESAVLQWRQSGLKEVQQRHESLLSPPGHLAQFQTNDQIM